ncbi:MAG TPA: hypothetical protein DDW55_04700 [Gammaproteobacteria bacterium]|nr:hypothetical protein [Gammaproteobacteria bacterium]
MSKTLSTIISATLLAVPFSIQASELKLDDMYRYEGNGAYDSPRAHAQHIKKSDVSLGEMYAFEHRDTYEFSSETLTTSSERAEFAVFSDKEKSPGDIPSLLHYLKWDDG